MRLLSVHVLQEGMILGRTIWNEASRPLLQKGVVITGSIIRRLKQLNVQYVYIEDKLSDGIEIKELVTRAERNRAVQTITKSFESLKDVNAKKASYLLDQYSKELKGIVEDLLQSVLNSDEMLTVLTDAFLYNEYIYEHSFQVSLYSIAIAKEMGHSYEDIRLIGIGALLHDVGKILVPNEILLKPGRLSNEEYEEIKQHARYGFDILRNLHSISLIVAHCAFQHHERLDGSGYPRGLVDFEIHPFAKIIGVADVFDAITSDRVYRVKMLPSDAMEVIEAGSGTIYCEAAVNALKRAVTLYPNGTTVRLVDGRRGVVSKQNSHLSARPFIRIFEENGEILSVTYEIDLAEHTLVEIGQVETDFVAIN